MILLTAMLALITATSAIAGGMGTVTVPFDTDIGSVNINTTASGRLIVVGHLDSGIPNAEYSVNIRVRYENSTNDVNADVVTFTTNGQGKASYNAQVEINPAAATRPSAGPRLTEPHARVGTGPRHFNSVIRFATVTPPAWNR